MADYGPKRRRLLISIEDELRAMLLELAALLASRIERYTDEDGLFPALRRAEMVNDITGQLMLFLTGPNFNPYGPGPTVATRSTLARFLHQAVTRLVTLGIDEQRDLIQRLPENLRLSMAVGTRARTDMPLPYWQARDANGLTLSDHILRAFEEFRRRLIAFLLVGNKPFDSERFTEYLDPTRRVEARGVSGINGGHIPSALVRTTLSSTEASVALFMAAYNPGIQMVNWRRSGHRAICKTSICDINEANSPYPIDKTPVHPAHGNCLCYYEFPFEGELRQIDDLADYVTPLSPLFLPMITGEIERSE